MNQAATVQEPSLAATGETPEIADQSACAPACQAKAETTSTSQMEEVLPAVKDLAVRVGGLDRLAELVAMLQTAKE